MSDLLIGVRDWKLSGPMRRPAMPEQMPNLRHNLIDGWAVHWPNPWESISAVKLLEWASLWWVGDEMCDLLYSTLADIPPETTVENLVIPETYGLVFLSKTWKSVDAATGGVAHVDAITWCEAVVGPERQPSLSVSSYRWIDFTNGFTEADGLLAQNLGLMSRDQINRDRLKSMGVEMKLREVQGTMQNALTGGLWAPLGRSDWPKGARLNAPSAQTHLGHETEQPLGESPFGPQVGTVNFDLSAEEDRRLVSALFTLLNTASLATVEERKPSRQVVRNAIRHKQKPPSAVKVVYLRRPKTVRRPGEPESEHHYSHRFAVRAHPRMQAYGPGRSLRKLIMVPAHIRGPQDAPFVAKQEVKAWVR